jgi:hypothetical protein
MNTTALIALCTLIAQIPFYGEIPENVPTYKMTFADGAVEYGALAVDGDWYTQETVSLPPGKTPTIVFDTPWAPRQDRPLRQPEFSFETLSLRKKRLADSWKSAGYEPVRTSQGELYAPKEEIRLAQRAQEMEAASMQASDPATTEAVLSEGTPPPPLEKGPVERWGTHAAVLAIGLTITYSLFRRFVLDS